MANECPSIAGHFDGHGEALKWYMGHRQMQHVQDRATPEATGRRHWATTRSVLPRRPPGRQQTKQRCIMYPLWWPFRWSSRCGGTIPRASPDGGGPGLSYKPLNTAIGRALAPIASIGQSNFGCFFDFIVKSLKKSSSCPNNNRGVTHQTDEKHLNNMSEYFVGVVNLVFNRYNNRFLWRVINQ